MLNQKCLNPLGARAAVAACALIGAIQVGFAPLQSQGAEAKDPAAKEAPKGWETVANAGVSLARGNSKNFLATAGVDSTRKWDRNEALLGASAGYGKATAVNRTDGLQDPETKTAAYLKGVGQFNHLFTDRVYGGLHLDGQHDDIADVYYRFTVSPLAGYYFIKKPATSLSADLGPAWVVEKVGDTGPRGYLALRLGERFQHKFENGARIWQTLDITPEISDWENYVVNFELGVEAPITKSVSARLVLQDTYDNEPSPSRLKNDVKLIAGISYKF